MPCSKLILVVCTTFSCLQLSAQYSDSSFHKSNLRLNNYNAEVKKPFPVKSLLLPGFMIAYGFTSLKSDGLSDWNKEIREEMWLENPHKKIHIDNFLQFAPALTVYGLNALGIHGKNNLKDRTLLYLMSNVFANGAVFSLKKFTNQQRPDGTPASFPSGHTAEAFASAEFLRQEYKDISPWYGIAGYAVAATTGYLRMYNNKHWLSDVVAGAGIGIASTKIAYWLYPKIKNRFFKKKEMNTFVAPYYSNKSAGLSVVYNFR